MEKSRCLRSPFLAGNAKRRGLHLKLVLALSAMWPLFAPAQSSADLILGLGQADNYAIFGITINALEPVDATNGSMIKGDVAIGPDGNLTVTTGARITGKLDLNTGATYSLLTGGSVGGPITTGMDFSQAETDIKAASASYAAESPTQTFGKLTSATTINSTTPVNVIDLTSIALSAGATLTLHGGSTDYFIINVGTTSGTAVSFNNGASIDLTGGLTANHVLFNVTESNTNAFGVQISGTLAGTFLAPSTGVLLSNGGNLTGAIYGDGSGASVGTYVTGGSTLTQASFDISDAPIAPVPEPSTLTSVAIAALLALGYGLNRLQVRRMITPLPHVNMILTGPTAVGQD